MVLGQIYSADLLGAAFVSDLVFGVVSVAAAVSLMVVILDAVGWFGYEGIC